MTVILSTKRETLAVLGADQRHGGGQPGYWPKVALHPSLPLAFTAGGLMFFPVAGRHEHATTHLEEFARTIRSADELIVREIGERLRVTFQPSMDLAQDSMHVFIALVKDGRADTAALRVTGAKCSSPPMPLVTHPHYAYIPPILGEFYQQTLYLRAIHDPAAMDGREIGRRVGEAIDTGIIQERALDPDGNNKLIGGNPDVVLVTDAGPPLRI
jgi:hypothetical protein